MTVTGTLSNLDHVKCISLTLIQHFVKNIMPNQGVRGFQVALVVKNPPAYTGEIRAAGSFLSWEDHPREGNDTQSSILA